MPKVSKRGQRRQSSKPEVKYLRTYIYVRLSEKDGGHGRRDSIYIQKQICEDYAKKHPEMLVVKVYADNGVTGTTFQRDAFEELMDVKDSCKYAQELDSTGAVLAKVAATPGAVGYVSLDVLDDTVNGLKINAVEPTEENILAGTYVLQRPFVMATKGEISEQSEQVQAYFDFINSEDGQNVIKSVGLIIPQK